MTNLFYTPLGTSLVTCLAEGLIDRTKDDPFSLARYLVLLPTRRGCLALQQAFAKRQKSGSLILPRIMALADLEEGAFVPGYLSQNRLAPELSSWQRLGLLTQLVLAFEKNKANTSVQITAATKMAQELMVLVDEIETTHLKLDNLHKVVTEEYAAHWQVTLDFLKILTDHWPPILESLGLMEPAARRREILLDLAQNWSPSYPVVLAGSTGTRPATVELMKSILTQPQGCVVLPSLDPLLLEQDLDRFQPTHPQFALADVLKNLKISSAAFHQIVPFYSSDQDESVVLSRQKLLSISMGEELHKAINLNEQSIEMIESASVSEEAKVIALIIRYHLDFPEKTIALVTPSTDLARRVMSELTRWGLAANISSGFPLSQSVVGAFFQLTAKLATALSAADFLAILKHPLCCKETNRLSHLLATRRYEMTHLRGQTIPFDILSLGKNLPMESWLQNLLNLCKPLTDLINQSSVSFKKMLEVHKQVAESLVGGEGGKLWEQEDGRVIQEFLENLLKVADSFPELSAHEYPHFFSALMSKETVRHVEGIGSRVSILGALEARLLTADVVILGGLNEGTWPAQSGGDPWFNRHMRQAFGLAPVDRKIGLSAHDFCTSFSVPEVYLTRSLKYDGAPTIASRWWQRLFAVTQDSLMSKRSWSQWAQQIDQPSERVILHFPEPRPPVTARPKRFSVTGIEMLMRDPYGIYAKHILNLRPLDPLDAEPSVADLGQAIHKALDMLIKEGHVPWEEGALERLLQLGRQTFSSLVGDPRAQAFWTPRFERIARWVIYQFKKEGELIQSILSECSGEIEIPTLTGSIVLHAKADRIDILTDDSVRLIDYKTGGVPLQIDVRMGYSPQLSLEGLIAQRGGFSTLAVRDIQALEYWKLEGGSPAGSLTSLKGGQELVDDSYEGIQALFECFTQESTPYLPCPNPKKAPAYNDYAHLERLKELGV